jgi:hypothetical protein
VGDDGAVRVDTRQLTLTVTGSYTVTASQRVGEVGVPFRSTLAASGGRAPLTWSASGGLPSGLAVDSHGVISGVPTRAGTYAVTFHFVDADGSASDAHLSLVVRPRLAIATGALKSAVAGHAYRSALSSRGGLPAVRWSIARGSLPGGLKLAARTGAISGSPTRAGAFRFTVRARDTLGATATKALVLRVR